MRLFGLPSCALESPPGRAGHSWIVTAVESSYLSIGLAGDADFRASMLRFIAEAGSFAEAYGANPTANRVEIDLDGRAEFGRMRWKAALRKYGAYAAVILVATLLGLACGKRFRHRPTGP